MKPINTSTYDFPTLVQEGFVYVDKTAQIYELAKRGTDHIYFFPRPRRFGKSLLISTLKALFLGRRDLFENLAIASTSWDWDREVYPVLHLDMSRASCENAANLKMRLGNVIRLECARFGIPHDPSLDVAANFENLLDGLAMKSSNGKFVLLIDEYESPISGLLESEETRRELPAVRKALHDFYIVAKAHCCDMRFLFVTGVSKFAKTSIISAFNNPKDLTFDARAADLAGYTHEELETYFHEHIQAFADDRNETYEQAVGELLDWYDSYQFAPKRLVKVVNPVSLGNALTNKQLGNYWEATAGSTLLFDALKAQNKAPLDLATKVGTNTLDAPDALTAPVQALLYQGGYLTIDQRVDDGRMLMKVPNNEVRLSLERGYISSILGKDFELDTMLDTALDTAAQLADEGYTENFKTMLQAAYSLLPHDWVCKDEKEAKRYFIAFMTFARAEVAGEPQHATGRPDAVIRTAKGIYVFEFKFDQSASAAIAQCRERNYSARFVGDQRPVYYVGINYNPAENVRTTDEITCEKVS